MATSDYSRLLVQARTALQAGRIDLLPEIVSALDAEGSDAAAGLGRELRILAAQRDEPELDGEWIEPLDAAPHAIAYLRSARGVLVARKSLARQWVDGEIEERFSSGITARMLLGIADDARVTDTEVTLSFRGLTRSERLAAFDSVCRDPWAPIEYPYVPLFGEDRHEYVSPLSDWDPSDRRCQELDNGEIVLRRHACQMIAGEDLGGRLVYDPACSTGAFLHAIKEQHPGCRTVGQDLHRGMVERARSRVDEVHAGDAKTPAVEDDSVDLLILRFLCWGTVSRASARTHFARLASTVRPRGRVLLVGHTPVLLAREELQAHGLEVERCSGFDPAAGVFQFYVLKKTGL